MLRAELAERLRAAGHYVVRPSENRLRWIRAAEE
jgi:hypothetical protein